MSTVMSHEDRDARSRQAQSHTGGSHLPKNRRPAPQAQPQPRQSTQPQPQIRQGKPTQQPENAASGTPKPQTTPQPSADTVAQLERLEKANAELSKQVSQLTAERDGATRDRDAAQKQLSEAQAQQKKVEADLAAANGAAKQHDDQIAALKEELTSLKAKVAFADGKFAAQAQRSDAAEAFDLLPPDKRTALTNAIVHRDQIFAAISDEKERREVEAALKLVLDAMQKAGISRQDQDAALVESHSARGMMADAMLSQKQRRATIDAFGRF